METRSITRANRAAYAQITRDLTVLEMNSLGRLLDLLNTLRVQFQSLDLTRNKMKTFISEMVRGAMGTVARQHYFGLPGLVMQSLPEGMTRADMERSFRLSCGTNTDFNHLAEVQEGLHQFLLHLEFEIRELLRDHNHYLVTINVLPISNPQEYTLIADEISDYLISNINLRFL